MILIVKKMTVKAKRLQNKKAPLKRLIEFNRVYGTVKAEITSSKINNE